MADAERMELQQKIADLDRKINEEVAKAGRVKTLRTQEVNFPLGTWILAIVVAAWWAAGGAILPDLHEQTAFWAFIVAAIIGLVAIYRTVMFVLRKVKPQKMGYSQTESAEMLGLRKQRAELQKKLDEHNKE